MHKDPSTLIQTRVSELFNTGKYNCSMTTLAVFSELSNVPISQQTMNAAQMMPGAGGVGDLCGFISGCLMFVGVWGGYHNLPQADLRDMSHRLSQSIQERFGSLHCRDLRDDCSILAVELLSYSAPILTEEMEKLYIIYDILK